MKIITITGLAIDIIGALLIYFNSPKVRFGVYMYNNDELIKLEKKASRMHRLTQLGALLLCLGFSMQICSSAMQ